MFGLNLFAVDKSVVTISADEFCPYNCKPDSAMPGFMVEIAKEALAMSGYKMVYTVSASWSEAVGKSNSGVTDGIVGTSRNDAEVSSMVFPQTNIGTFDNCFLSRSSSKWKYDGLESLKRQKLVSIDGYGYGDKLNNYIRQNRTNPKRTRIISGNRAMEYAFTNLKQGKVDLYVDSCSVLEYALKTTKDSSGYKIAGKMNESYPIFVAFSQKNKNSALYAKALDDGIAKMKKSGRYAEIIKKYGVVE